MQDEGSLDSSSRKACQNKSLIGCFCMQCFAVDWMLLYAMFLQMLFYAMFLQMLLFAMFFLQKTKFKTNSVFWIFLVVVFSFMDSHKDMNVNKFRIPTTKHFFKWGKCETLKGVNCVVYWWWVQRKGAWKQSGGDVNLLLPTFIHVFPTFSAFKVVCHEHHFAFSPAISVLP